MFYNNRTLHIASLIGLLIITLIGCQMLERAAQSPTTPATGDSSALTNYAQMEDGSAVVDGQQINWVVSKWGSLPYGYWIYVEVNQQDAVGQPPGDHQVPVTLGDVVLHFSDLPGEVTQILIGVKAVHDDTDDTFTEIGRFVVVAGSVSIPLAYADLVYYFGVTHYSIWFQVIGGNNEEGTACGTITLSGVMPGGQQVYLSKRICFGTNPAPAPSTPTTTPGNAAPVASGVSISGTWQVGDPLTGNYTYSDAEGDPEGASTYQWYRADDNSGTNAAAIGGATNQTYTLQAADAGKFMRFEVIPVTSSGTSPGSAAASAWSGPVGTANAAPVASGVSISGGTRYVGETLTGNYTYTDAEGDPEGVSTYQWYRDGTPIGGATNQTYTVQAADLGKCLYFVVIPVAQTGTSPGSAVKSACFGIPWPIILYNAGLHDGDLGGRIGADALCLAAKPPLPPQYFEVKAFISVQGGDSIFDLMMLMMPWDGPITSVGGTQLFANIADMLDGTNPPISLLAAGVVPTNTGWWSGSTMSGFYNPGFNQCDNWMNNGIAYVGGIYGNSDAPPNGHWMNGGLWLCNEQRYLLCITYGP